MVAARATHIPFEHVVAELAAAPFSVEEALRFAPIELDPRMDSPTKLLWRAVENSVLRSFPAFSVDEVVALRDWLWFGEPKPAAEGDPQIPLGDFLANFARSTMIFAGNAFRPSRPQWSEAWKGDSGLLDDPFARRYWRWISFALPQDLLIAAHPHYGSVGASVDLISPTVKRILEDEEYAEPHIHLGAALDFSLLWISLQHALVDPKLTKIHSFCSPGAILNDGQHLAVWLVHAAIARYICASYLHQKFYAFSKEHKKTFAEFIEEDVESEFQVRSPRFIERRMNALDETYASDQQTGAFRWHSPHMDTVPPTTNVNIDVQPNLTRSIRQSLFDFEQGTLIESEEQATESGFLNAQRLFSKLTGLKRKYPKFPTSHVEALRSDPISEFFPVVSGIHRSAEIQFVSAGLRYLNTKEGRDDRLFARVFWQVVRVRCLYFRTVVQRPLTPGLQWFIRFYDRLRPARRPISRPLLVETAAFICGKDIGLKSLEVRMSPPDTLADAKKQLEEIIEKFEFVKAEGRKPLQRDDDGASFYNNSNSVDVQNDITYAAESAEDSGGGILDNDPNKNRPFEFGITYHFVRDRADPATLGFPCAHAIGSYSDPSTTDNGGYRYSYYYTKVRKECLAIASLIQKYPRILYFLRAVDVCADETGVPNWVISPLIRYLRKTSRAASAHLLTVYGEPVPPLRVTAHAGEDFIHLLSGMRRVDETIELMQMSQGDRLGHGISLGVNPLQWAAETRGVAISRMHRLMDLSWEWTFSKHNEVELPSRRTQFILDEIETLTRSIFGQFLPPTRVAEFVRILHDEAELFDIGFPSGPIPNREEFVRRRFNARYRSGDRPAPHTPAKEEAVAESGAEPWILFYQYMVDDVTFRLSETRILTDPSSEAETLDQLQRALRRKVGNLGVTVEINPSSNLLIGDMADLSNHPLWRLNPPRPSDPDAPPPLSVCIGSDDPITFATNTREEYQLVFDSLTLSGLSDFEARKWLDEVRRVGLNTRFTFQHSKAGEQIWYAMDIPNDHTPLPP